MVRPTLDNGVRMDVAAVIHPETTSRDLVRRLRTGLGAEEAGTTMPESLAWHVFLELERRGEPDAARLFVAALRTLHSRRTIAGVNLGVLEVDADEHRLVDDLYLADLWKSYKKCIRTQKTGPASQLLRDIEAQLHLK
jgi:hypothetical protein